jgi:hypothetical protein
MIDEVSGMTREVLTDTFVARPEDGGGRFIIQEVLTGNGHPLTCIDRVRSASGLAPSHSVLCQNIGDEVQNIDDEVFYMIAEVLAQTGLGSTHIHADSTRIDAGKNLIDLGPTRIDGTLPLAGAAQTSKRLVQSRTNGVKNLIADAKNLIDHVLSCIDDFRAMFHDTADPSTLEIGLSRVAVYSVFHAPDAHEGIEFGW